jgi:hypothetical protein
LYSRASSDIVSSLYRALARTLVADRLDIFFIHNTIVIHVRSLPSATYGVVIRRIGASHQILTGASHRVAHIVRLVRHIMPQSP